MFITKIRIKSNEIFLSLALYSIAENEFPQNWNKYKKLKKNTIRISNADGDIAF